LFPTPFYSEDYKTRIKESRARFQDAMPFEDLIEAADLLLVKTVFSVIIPFKEEELLALPKNMNLPHKNY
jgi:tRNA1Val (adenine37-N6)-methyltransferase